MAIQERQIHELFEVSVLLKGAHAVIECIGGVLLALTNTSAIVALVNRITQEELIEDRSDFIATHLLNWAHSFSLQTQHFYGFYLLSHGVVKLALVAGLLRRKLLAYPASLVVMTVFIAYQIYRYTFTHGIGLGAVDKGDSQTG